MALAHNPTVFVIDDERFLLIRGLCRYKNRQPLD
jgi:hypothetical protein